MGCAVAGRLDNSTVISLLLRVDRRSAIILFDAMCVLCSANAQFVLRHDRRRRFKLASMQGEVGAALFKRHGIDPADPDTILVVDGDRVLRDSDAVLAIYAGLGWPWRAAGVLRLVPKAVTTLASVHLDLPCYDRRAVDGLLVPSAAIAAISARLAAMSVPERAQPALHRPGTRRSGGGRLRDPGRDPRVMARRAAGRGRSRHPRGHPALADGA